MYIFLAGSALAVTLAWRAGRFSEKRRHHLLLFLAVLFPLSELGKQVLLYIGNGGSYNW